MPRVKRRSTSACSGAASAVQIASRYSRSCAVKPAVGAARHLIRWLVAPTLSANAPSSCGAALPDIPCSITSSKTPPRSESQRNRDAEINGSRLATLRTAPAIGSFSSISRVHNSRSRAPGVAELTASRSSQLTVSVAGNGVGIQMRLFLASIMMPTGLRLPSIAVNSVGAGIAPAGHYRQTPKVMSPTFAMRLDRFRRQAAVLKAQQRSAIMRQQVDLDQRGAGRNVVAAVLPTKRIGQARYRHDLGKLAVRHVSLLDIDQHQAARPRIDFGRRPHPSNQPLRIGKEREHRSLIRVDRHLLENNVG